MDLYASHRRLLLWLHWVAVSTAGCGTFASLLALHWFVVNAERNQANHFLLFQEFVCLLVLELACLAAILVLQQLILERVGLSATYWLPGTFGGAFVGLLVGFPAGLIS